MKTNKWNKYGLLAVVFIALTAFYYSANGAQTTQPVQASAEVQEGGVSGQGAQRPAGQGQAGATDGQGPAGAMNGQGSAGTKNDQGPAGMPSGKDMMQAMGGKGTATPVETEVLSLQAIGQEVKTLGIVSPGYEVGLGAQGSGTVSTIEVAVGDVVTAGTVLYRLDGEDVEQSASNDLAVVSNALEGAQNAYDVAKAAYEEAKLLYGSGAMSENDLESAYNTLESAQLTLEAKQINYENALSSNHTSFDDLLVKAPVDGIISAVDIVVGDRSSASDITLVDLSDVIIETMVSGNVVKDLVKGDAVTVYSNDVKMNGHISKIDLLGTSGTDSYGVEVTVDNLSGNLRPGYRVDVLFEVKRLENQMVVDKRAVLTDVNGDYVYIVEDNQATRKTVVQGLTFDGKVQITGEIALGDAVIVNGQTLITDQSMVKVSNKK